MITVVAAQIGQAPKAFKFEQSTLQSDIERLTNNGYSILETNSPNLSNSALSVWASLFGKRNRFDTALFATQLRALLSAGISVAEAIQTLTQNEPQTYQRLILQSIGRDLTVGLSLSAAMKQQGNLFDSMLVATVMSAERSGNLQASLQRYSRFTTARALMRNRLLSMLIYPSVLAFVGLNVVAFLLLFVVPRFAATIQQGRATIPFSSQILLTVSQFLSEYGIVLALALVFFVSAVVLVPIVRTKMLAAMTSLPLFDSLTLLKKRFWQSQFFDATALLLNAGFTITQAIRAASTLLPRSAKTNVEAAAIEIEQGQSITATLASHGLATGISLAMIRAGEKSGTLDQQLLAAAQFLEDDLIRDLERWLKAAEPVLMLVIGAITGLVLALLYIPIFELAGSLK